jgi:AcrR family transcriptional regulator
MLFDMLAGSPPGGQQPNHHKRSLPNTGQPIVQKTGRPAVVEHDRRVRRTRSALTDAFLALVVEKGYDKITVQDILDRADIGRSTFYAHYRDKEALLLACFDDMQKQLRSAIDAVAPTGPPIDLARPVDLLFDHAYRNKRVYRALCRKQGGDTVKRYLHGVIGQLVAETLGPELRAHGSDLQVDVTAEFYTAAALGLLTWWIDHDFCRGPTWLTIIYRELATHGAPIAFEK